MVSVLGGKGELQPDHGNPPFSCSLPNKEAFEEKVVEVGQDTSSGICGYVISGYRTHKKEHGTRPASASGNPLLFQWQRPMLACFQS